MVLSKIFMPLSKPKSIYEIHQDLWTAFQHHDQSPRFLYRVERQQIGYGAEILLQSATEPQRTSAVNVLACRDYTLTLHEQQRLRFLLVANPVKTLRLDKNNVPLSKPCRVPLLKEEDQQAWLARKFDGLARLDSLITRPCPPLYFRKKVSGAGKINPVAFEGVLTVQNADDLQTLMQNGIGAAKAFGCGLLSIARVV